MNNFSDFIYLDNNSSTMVDPDVLTAMLPFYSDCYGNVSNTLNSRGYILQKELSCAIRKMARFFHSTTNDIFLFTSGATEANNLVLRSFERKTLNPHIITTSIEHASILETCKALEKKGVEISYVMPNHEGIISPGDIKYCIKHNTALISVMGANNEIGTIQPIEEIAKIAHSYNIPFHSDISQLISSKRIDLRAISFDFLTFSGHKIHAPIGIGCLYINKSCRGMINPLIMGGNQQHGLRSGTINVPGIIGLSTAIDLLANHFDSFNAKILSLRNKLFDSLASSCNVSLNGSFNYRINNNLSLVFPGVSSFAMASKAQNILFSSSSACSISTNHPSHVLKSIGLSDEDIQNTIRIGLSRFNTDIEIEKAAFELKKAYFELRK